MLTSDVRKFKTISLKAIMDNKNLRKEVFGALKSPMGSTQRKKAKDIFNSISTVSYRNFGGKGGAPMVDENNVVINAPSLADISKTRGQVRTASGLSAVPTPKETVSSAGQGMVSSTGDQVTETATPVATPTNLKIFPSAPEPVATTTATPTIPEQLREQVMTQAGQLLNQFPGGEIDSWYTALSPEEQTRFKPVYDAAKSKVGPKTFGMQLQTDTKKLEQLFPGWTKEMLPEGASDSLTIGDLDKALQMEYGLNQKADKLSVLKAGANTIKDQLGDYVKDKDEYVKHVDNIIGKTQTAMANMDMSNPEVRKRMNNYLNYLFTVKGRQQIKYDEYIQRGINEFNQELRQSQENYDNAYNQYQRELSAKTKDIEAMKDAAGEMVSAVSDLEKNSMQLYNLKASVIKNASDIADSALKASAASGEGWAKVSDTNQAKARSKYLDSLPADLSASQKETLWNELPDVEKEIWVTNQPLSPKNKETLGFIYNMIKDGEKLEDILSFALTEGLDLERDNPEILEEIKVKIENRVEEPGFLSKVGSAFGKAKGALTENVQAGLSKVGFGE
jgi:hypothetical protein